MLGEEVKSDLTSKELKRLNPKLHSELLELSSALDEKAGSSELFIAGKYSALDFLAKIKKSIMKKKGNQEKELRQAEQLTVLLARLFHSESTNQTGIAKTGRAFKPHKPLSDTLELQDPNKRIQFVARTRYGVLNFFERYSDWVCEWKPGFVFRPAYNEVRYQTDFERSELATKSIIKYFGPFIGPNTMDFFSNNHPIVCSLDKKDFRKTYASRFLDFVLGCNVGMYFGVGNVSVVLKESYDQLATTIHESLHYLSLVSRVGGFLSYFSYGGQRDKKVTFLPNLNEGMTEYFTQKICRTTLNQEKPDYVAYSMEVRTVCLLVDLLGEDVIARAYLTSDLKELNDKLDSVLGAGTFSRLIKLDAGTRGYFHLFDSIRKNKTDIDRTRIHDAEHSLGLNA